MVLTALTGDGRPHTQKSLVPHPALHSMCLSHILKCWCSQCGMHSRHTFKYPDTLMHTYTPGSIYVDVHACRYSPMCAQSYTHSLNINKHYLSSGSLVHCASVCCPTLLPSLFTSSLLLFLPSLPVSHSFSLLWVYPTLIPAFQQPTGMS